MCNLFGVGLLFGWPFPAWSFFRWGNFLPRRRAIVGTAVLFSLAHGVVEAIPPLLVFGVGLAWVRVRADSVWPCVIAHGTYNAIAIGATLAI